MITAFFVCKNAQKKNIKIYKLYSCHKEKQFLQYLKQDMQFFDIIKSIVKAYKRGGNEK